MCRAAAAPPDAAETETAAVELSTSTKRLTESTIDGHKRLPVTFKDLSYTVGKEPKQKKILSDLTGVFQVGRMCALLGPSGCGKTSLIDVISGRKNTGKVTGSINFGGASCTLEHRKHLVGYVEQFDNLVGELTVAEMLMYTARLKLPVFDREAQAKRVEEVIEALNLSSCRSTIIGGPLKRGVSGGQLKRCNIGLALITRPPILFLDEPTSGLDSFMAHEVCLILSQLASEGRTVVATIHSPTSKTFALFDDLMMLREGLMTYGGPSNEAEKYFTAVLGLPPLGVGTSLPEWLIDFTCASPQGWEGLGSDGAAVEGGAFKPLDAQEVAEVYRKSEACAALLAAAQANGSEGGGKPVKISPRLARAGPLTAVKVLLDTRGKKDYQSPDFLGPRIGDKVIFSLVVMSMYWGEGNSDDPQAIQSVSGVLFMITALCGYGAAAVVPTLVLDRPLFYREINDGCYGSLSYFAYKIVSEGFITIWTSLLFILVVYWAVGFQGNFGMMVLIYYCTSMISIALAYAIACIAPNLDVATAMLPTYVTIAMFGGGLIMTIESMPAWWSWFHWTSFIRYAWAAQMNNQFKGTDSGEVRFIIGSDGTKQNILEFFSIEGSFLGSSGVCLGMLALLLAVYITCGCVVIKKTRHESR